MIKSTSVRMMLAIVLLLCTVEVAYLNKLFYWGQVRIIWHRYFPPAPQAVDTFHQPLLGCEALDRDNIHTHFFHVSVKTVEVPVGENHAGGGLTSRGKQLLVLRGDGSLHVLQDDSLVLTGVELPTTENEAFQAGVQAGRYPQPHSRFRYEDILAHEDGIYLSFTRWNADLECYSLNVAWLPISADVPIEDIEATAEDWLIMYTSSPCIPVSDAGDRASLHMAGGRMALLGTNELLLTVGNFSVEESNLEVIDPQSDANPYGKVVSINLEDHSHAIYSKGHRNLQGIFVDIQQKVWGLEHGPRGGDELNLLARGNNYGWPEATLGTAYNSLPIASATEYGRHNRHTPPVYSWIPSRGVSNLIQIDNFDAAWDGDFLVGSLIMKRIYRLRIRGNRVLFSEPICIGERVRYVHQHVDHRIFVWTDAGVLYIIERPLKEDKNKLAEGLIKLRPCLECHGADGSNADIPGIEDLGRLSSTRISAYVSNPQAFNPQSQMPAFRLSEQEMAEIILALHNINQSE